MEVGLPALGIIIVTLILSLDLMFLIVEDGLVQGGHSGGVGGSAARHSLSGAPCIAEFWWRITAIS